MLNRWFSHKHSPREITLYAPLSGMVVGLADVPDAVFSQKLAGDGAAIQPSEDTVVAPADGVVTHLFPTGHAIGVTCGNGLELLIHIGIDTVKLNGQGFTPLVSVGDKVRTGQELIRFDQCAIEAAGFPTITPMVITNGERIASLVARQGSPVRAGYDVLLTAVMRT